MSEDIIKGTAYVPGVAEGRLHIGLPDAAAGQLVLCRPEELTAYTELPAGFIVVDAAPFSHPMIRLLGLGVPTVLIDPRQAGELVEGGDYRLDGGRGILINNIKNNIQVTEIYDINTHPEAVAMANGEPLDLLASVRHSTAASKAKTMGAKSIGLVRSEFLVPPDGQTPDAAFYQRAFGELCDAASPLPVTIRLLDVASDKIPLWLTTVADPDELHAYQGVRLWHIAAVRRVVDAQLDALAELAGTYRIRVLIPYLTRVEEYDYWRTILEAHLPDTPLGAMLETPAAVLAVDAMLKHADFVAIGCNDLMQFLYAADRDRPDLRHYLDPYAPVLYQLLQQVAERAGPRLGSVQLCGVLSQIQGVLPILLGLGYRTFSVDPIFIPQLAGVAAKLTRDECENLAAHVCAAASTEAVLQHLQLPPDRHAPFLI